MWVPYLKVYHQRQLLTHKHLLATPIYGNYRFLYSKYISGSGGETQVPCYNLNTSNNMFLFQKLLTGNDTYKRFSHMVCPEMQTSELFY